MEVVRMALPKEDIKTIADIEALPEGTRAELIDGELFYDLAAPSSNHQRLVNFLVTEINLYIRSKGGKCEVFPSPYDVQLKEDDNHTLVQPDVSVICNRDKIKKNRCVGAPDWVIEVVSPSTERRDYIYKLNKYLAAGVREYWIVDPERDRAVVYNLEAGLNAGAFEQPKTLKDKVKVNIYPGLEIDFSQLEL